MISKIVRNLVYNCALSAGSLILAVFFGVTGNIEVCAFCSLAAGAGLMAIPYQWWVDLCIERHPPLFESEVFDDDSTT